MRLLIVRHGDPDYSIDSLTEKGWKEAEYLSERLSKLDVKDFYVSPLGRAKDTASFTLKKMNRTAVECDWLREFDVLIARMLLTGRRDYGIGFHRTGHRMRDFTSMITGMKTRDFSSLMPKDTMTM